MVCRLVSMPVRKIPQCPGALHRGVTVVGLRVGTSTVTVALGPLIYSTDGVELDFQSLPHYLDEAVLIKAVPNGPSTRWCVEVGPEKQSLLRVCEVGDGTTSQLVVSLSVATGAPASLLRQSPCWLQTPPPPATDPHCCLPPYTPVRY
jgi:hypothetical protein